MTIREFAYKYRRWLWAGGIVLGVAYLLVALRVLVLYFVPNDIEAKVAEYASDYVSLPEPWHQPAELPSAAVIEFHRRLGSVMQEIRSEHDSLFDNAEGSVDLTERYKGPPLTSEERTSFSAVMADLQPIIDETSAAVCIDGYTYESDSHLMRETLTFRDATLFAKLVSLAAYEQAIDGNCQAAMELVALPLRLVKRPEQSYLITHLTGTFTADISAHGIYHVSEKCSDLDSLQLALNLMDELRDDVIKDTTNIQYAEGLTILRFAAAYGYPVDLFPQSFASLLQQLGQVHHPAYFQFLADNLPPDDPRVEIAQMRAWEISDDLSSDVASSLNLFNFLAAVVRIATGMDGAAMTYASTAPDFDEARTRIKNSLVHYDLTRMDIARRLGSMDSNSTITAYLSPLPSDPFSKASFLFSDELQKHYSVGPDTVDEGAQILYDVTNGTQSSGDIWMKTRESRNEP